MANGTHTLTAVARDAAGNTTTSSPVSVTVNNPAVDPTGLVGAWGFEEATRHHRHRLVGQLEHRHDLRGHALHGRAASAARCRSTASTTW